MGVLSPNSFSLFLLIRIGLVPCISTDSIPATFAMVRPPVFRGARTHFLCCQGQLLRAPERAAATSLAADKTFSESRLSVARLMLPSVAYEDDDLLIINKPAGIGFHDEEDGTKGILSVIRTMQAQGLFHYTGRLHGVHRLDKVTSGCLILAKTPSAAGEAISALRDKRVAKYYIALSDKKPSKKQGTVSGDMERTRRSAWRLTNTRGV